MITTDQLKVKLAEVAAQGRDKDTLSRIIVLRCK